MTTPSDAALPADFTLVGMLVKPYGLLGEIKVRPETFDFDRYKSLTRVFARSRSEGHSGEIIDLTIRAARADGHFWYFKFDDRRTPEAVAELSGRELLIDSAERLELPEGMVYFSDIPGMQAVDERGEPAGELVEVREAGPIEYLVLRAASTSKEVLVPWNDHFVKKIDKAARVAHLDLSALRGVVL
jgi:16S rRNA processing protein RimM